MAERPKRGRESGREQPEPAPPTSAAPSRFETAVVVFEGNINPSIFTLAWFAKYDLVDAKEAEKANVKFMAPELSRFDVSHFRVEARRDRVTVASTKALSSFDPVKDMLEGIFRILPHTPIQALAMSKAAHLELPDAGRGMLGSPLLSHGLWSDLLTEPHVLVMSVGGSRDDEQPGSIEVTVEQSQHVDGLYVVATERIEFPITEQDPKAPEHARGARPALDALGRRWPVWIRRATSIVKAIEAAALEASETAG